MKKFVLLSAVLGVTVFILPASAQQRYSDLSRVAGELEDKIKGEVPEWSLRRSAPASLKDVRPSDNVIILRWIRGKRAVKVAIVRYQSNEEAAASLRQFAEGHKDRAVLHGLGDDAYVWGVQGSIAFRQSNLVIYISSVVTILGDTDSLREGAKNSENTAQTEQDEEKNVSRGFAHRVSSILKNL